MSRSYYYYLDATPTHSYLKMLYKYPQASIRTRAGEENRARGIAGAELRAHRHRRFRREPLLRRVRRVCARREVDDVLMRSRSHNRGPDTADLHLLPQLLVPQHLVLEDTDLTERPRMAA